MIRARKFPVWLLVITITSACSAPAPSTRQVPQNHSTDAPPIVETAHPIQISTPTRSPSPHGTLPAVSGPIHVKVDTGNTYQTIDGFGATHNSLEYEGRGDTISPELRLDAIDAVYRQVGLNMGNLEGGLLESPGGYDQRSNDNNDPDEFNWPGFQTFSADAIRSSLLVFAEPLGFDGFYIGQRVNVRWASPWLGELRSANYDLYLEEAAEQVAAGLVYWRDRYGIVPRYIMLFNEPLTGNRELQSGNVQEVVDLVKVVGARLNREGFTSVRFVLPNEETAGGSLSVATAILSDPVARMYIGAIGYHAYPYGSPYSSIPNVLNTSGVGAPDPDSVAVRDRLHQLSQQYGIPVWMTEVSHGEVDPTSFDDFRGRAIHIHDELVYAHASAYFGMNNMWDTFSQEAHFGNQSLFDYSSEGTIVLIDTNQQKIYISGMGYAIGHYARWVKPGAVRVDALSSDVLLQVTSFLTPDSNQLILVLINNHPDPKEINLEIEAAEIVGSISGEQSAADNYWVPLKTLSASSADRFSIILPSRSVTTLSLSLSRNFADFPFRSTGR